MPTKLMQDIFQGYLDKENAANSDLMRYKGIDDQMTDAEPQQEIPADDTATQEPAQQA